MNVSYSDTVTNTVKTLRENVYCKESFKEEFTTALNHAIGAIDTAFVPEQFGGWAVNVTTNRSEGEKLGINEQTSTSYLGKVTEALGDTIHNIDCTIAYKDVISNLANVVVTGQQSLTVKL